MRSGYVADKELENVNTAMKFTAKEMRERLLNLFEHEQFNPVKELIQIAKTSKKEETVVSICKFLTEFLVPKLKSIEVSGSVDHTHTVVIRRFGPDGQRQDTPIQQAASQQLRELARPTEKLIDAEVVK